MATTINRTTNAASLALGEIGVQLVRLSENQAFLRALITLVICSQRHLWRHSILATKASILGETLALPVKRIS